MRTVYFVTGATGFVGSAFLKAAALRNVNAVFYCLVRGAGRALTAQERLAQALQNIGAPYDRARFIAIEGDIEAPRFGLSDADLDFLLRRVQIIVHSAAAIGFLTPFDQLKAVNVDGARRAAAFARCCAVRNPSFMRFGYVSSAYAVGGKAGVVEETIRLTPGPFRNAYERSKHLAENFVRAAAKTAPVTIFRPSMVIGAASDEAPAPGPVLTPSLKMLSTGRYPAAPVDPDCPMDFTPVDYVAQAIDRTLTASDAPGSLALVSGEAYPYVLSDLIALYNERRVETLPRFRAVSAQLHCAALEKLGGANGMRAKIALFERAYLPYLRENPRFANAKAAAFLERLGVRSVDPLPVIGRIMDAAFASGAL